MNPRAMVKGLLEAGATRFGPARAAEHANRGSIAVLSYHNIVPDGERQAGDRSLHLLERDFREQLDFLQSRYAIVGLDKLGTPNETSRPRVAITFDDAYAGAVVSGLAEVARRGLAATMFVSTGLLDRRSFWWDRLADEHGVVAPERRNHVLWELRGSDEDARNWMATEGISERNLPEHALSASVAELARATEAAGISVGAHGSGHLNMAALDPPALRLELLEPSETLGGDWPAYRPWLAYPYGLCSDMVVDAAGEHYTRGCRIEGGLARPPDIEDRPHAIPRINVPAGLSVRGLHLRVAGILS